MDTQQHQGNEPLTSRLRRWARSRRHQALAGLILLAFAAWTWVGVEYLGSAAEIDRKLREGAFSGAVNVYAAAPALRTGDPITEEQLAQVLYRAGLRERPGANAGWFRRSGRTIELHESGTSARIRLANGKVESLIDGSGAKVEELRLPPELIANISAGREKRRPLRFGDLPPVLVNAVLSAEDKRFFRHSGFDGLRLMKAAYSNLRDGRRGQGGSTITMQLARNLWLGGEKTIGRKFREMLIAAHLERKLSKQQIFERYANEVYLGRRGTYNIHGFGQAAWELFGKDVRSITLPEAALLAGLIQRPSSCDPARHPDRAKARRNVVLRLMLANGAVSRDEYGRAVAEPVKAMPASGPEGEAQYVIDLLGPELQPFEDQPLRDVYTTIDPELQRVAAEAVDAAMPRIDKAVARYTKDGAKPQVALVALDPQTGEIKALIGGRSYAESQLNRATARRPVGSTFKPFVYAAALSASVSGVAGETFTPASLVSDEPTAFQFGEEIYEPGNYHNDEYGEMTLRRALMRSDNIAAVKVAEAVGYQRVAELARQAGLQTARGTPSVALGAYDATPLELAGAYTVFATQGTAVKPSLLASVRATDGRVIHRNAPRRRAVLDARVAFLINNMMESVVNSGTGYGARAAGFNLPAAGKTGTSRDGWFAGYSTRLLTVVWVGFDDYRDLRLEGAQSALPVWTEFMKRAHKLRPYSGAGYFRMPDGITTAQIDPESGLLAGSDCLETRTEYFIAGTEPLEVCHRHGFLAGTGVIQPAAMAR